VIGDVSKAADAISSALTSLNAHRNHSAAKPYFGRVLGLLAYSSMHQQSAVTAEGFYRSAIEKLPTNDHDLR
jgi:hypothetical protein